MSVKLSDVAGRASRPEVKPLVAGDPPELGGYRLQGRIGRGGMGTVYLGATRSGRLLAVKVISPDQAGDSTNRERFRREVRAAAEIRSPRTATVIDWDVDAETPWLASEYLPWPTLADVVREHGPLPEEAVRELALGLVDALTAIHGAGLVHRDVKPSNILIGDDGPRLIDLGIVTDPEGPTLTHSQEVLGTPQYMSPEQALGRPVTAASDLWSLGAVVYAAATGVALFGRGTPPEVTHRVVYAQPVLDALPEGLRPLVRACVAKDPAERPELSDVAGLLEAREPAGRVLPPRPGRVRRVPQEPPAGAEGGRRRFRMPGRAVVVGLTAAAVTIGVGLPAYVMSRNGTSEPPAVAGDIGTLPDAAAPRSTPPSPAGGTPEPSSTPTASPDPTPSARTPEPSTSLASGRVHDDAGRQENALPSFTAGTARLPASVEVGEEIVAEAVGFSPRPDDVTCTWSVGGVQRDTLGACRYVVAMDDVGSVIQARVTAVRDGYEKRSELTGFTDPVPRPRVPAPRCEITLWRVEASSRWGDATCRVEQDPEVRYEWRWKDLATGATVGEAEVQTQDRVWVRSEHAGHTIRCTVTASRDGWTTGEWVTEVRVPPEGGLERADG